MKTITLLALSLMLRPSDIAPNASVACSDHVDLICFNSNQVQFFQDKAKFTFFGIKNDTSRTGFEVVLPRANDSMLDPV